MEAEPEVIVITGASGGIGAALARKLGAAGHRLVLAARRAAELEAVARDSGEAIAVVVDVSVRADVERLRDAALQRFGGVDVWINNAGRGIGKPVLALTESDVDEMFTVNTKSALWGMQAIVPHFQERGRGHLINVSSMLGRVPLASIRSAYSAAKAALNSLTANLRMDLRATHPGIHVSLVMPGPVKTDFHAAALGGTPGGAPPGQSPEEVADVIVKLIAEPQPEVFTAKGLEETMKRYYQDIAAFEATFRPR
jgi:short-subunit dehydrogenase